VQVTPELPDTLSQLQFLEKVLQGRLVTRGTRPVLQVLVKWSASPASLATWEDFEALRQRFSGAAAWGQAAYIGEAVLGVLIRQRETELLKILG
jgi:hypothetical protein